MTGASLVPPPRCFKQTLPPKKLASNFWGSVHSGWRFSSWGHLARQGVVGVPDRPKATYDIWDTNHRYEIMLWLNYTGTPDGCANVKPISYNWHVYRGTNGANSVYSFLALYKNNSNDVDVKALLNWLKNNGWMGDEVMGEMQFGFEITSSAGGMNFGSQNFNVNFW